VAAGLVAEWRRLGSVGDHGLEEDQTMAVTNIGHVAIRCSDLDASLAFYAKLGLHEAFRLNRDDGSVNLVYVQVNDGAFLELFPGGAEPAEASRTKTGYVHACLLVDDVQVSYREATAKGIPTAGEPKLGRDGNWQFWITDPDGTRIEMMQIMPDSLQARAAKQLDAAR
jgi:lactoylglutathione lyase